MESTMRLTWAEWRNQFGSRLRTANGGPRSPKLTTDDPIADDHRSSGCRSGPMIRESGGLTPRSRFN